MNTPLINCDLGEWESLEQTAAFMPLIDMANIACGGHAGSQETLRACLRLCEKHSVKPGAHPGLTGNKGRSSSPPTADAFHHLLETQTDLFLTQCASLSLRPHHLKLHGSLYHFTETLPTLRDIFLEHTNTHDLSIVCLADGAVARALGPRALQEVFLDRGYEPDGQLVPRNSPSAVLESVSAVSQRIRLLRSSSSITAIDGSPLRPTCHTLCVHSDSDHALEFLRATRG